MTLIYTRHIFHKKISLTIFLINPGITSLPLGDLMANFVSSQEVAASDVKFMSWLLGKTRKGRPQWVTGNSGIYFGVCLGWECGKKRVSKKFSNFDLLSD